MPQRCYDRVKETTTTTGTGSISLAGAASQYVAFSSRFATGSITAADPFYYAIVGQSGTEWEVGRGHLSGASNLVRDVVFGSSNGDALVDFSAGTKDVFNTVPGERVEEIFTKGQSYAAQVGMNGYF